MSPLEPHRGGGHFDAVVVGSGFGGSVAAFRFAEAGKRVLLLERGQAWPPGSFARSPADLAANVWDPSDGRYGLFNLWSFQGIDSLVSSGLGGGSLIYANVLLRKDPSWFVQDHPYDLSRQERWPVGYEDLEPHYEHVEAMMAPQLLPYDQPGYRLAKTAALEEAAGALGRPWGLVPLAVRFRDEGAPAVPGAPLSDPPYGSLHGLPRRACRLCGECDLGCNDGAKNTLDHTYVAAARHHGAIVSVQSEVRSISRRDGAPGFEVTYAVHDLDPTPRPSAERPIERVTATKVVVAAGALGSTYLLLRNRAGLPGLSHALGTRFCGNGDLLGFVLRARGAGGSPRRLDASRGPVITSAMRLPDRADTGDPSDLGAYLEDAGYPGFADWLVEASGVVPAVRRAVAFGARQVWRKLGRSGSTDLSGELGALLGTGSLSSTAMPLLGMGRDVPDGLLYLAGGTRLDSTWSIATSKEYFDRLESEMGAVATHLRGRFHVNPTWFLKRVITVHPLGGCPMAADPSEGVVDADGQAFGEPGLYVTDGAALPGPVGANPSLTIAAFADRVAERALEGPWPSA